jgi:glycosyltransferase involved in cell wall biosynthesis
LGNSNKLLSIVTVNLINAVGLLETIESVKSQELDFEFIIVDGGSEDDSLKIIKEHQAIITECFIGLDRGIYDAMNIGLHSSTGKYLLFLNSGDILTKQISQDVLEQSNADFIIYGTDLSNGYFKIVREPIVQFIKDFSLPHQSTFIKRTLFNKWGDYNVNYKVTGDFEWFCRVFLQSNPNTLLFDDLLVKMQPGGLSFYPSCDWFLERDWVKFKYFYSLDILFTLRGCWRTWLKSFKEVKFKNRTDIL